MTPSFSDPVTLKEALNPRRQELWSPNLNKSRFRGTDSIKTTLKDNDDASLQDCVILVKHCSSLSEWLC